MQINLAINNSSLFSRLFMEFKQTKLTTALLATLVLSACGGSGSSSKKDDVQVTPIANTAPSDISLTISAVDENAAGAVVGTLSATDADGGTITFTVDNDNFVVSGNELSLAENFAADFEAGASLTLNITATDDGDLSFEKEFTIDVNDLLDTYTFNSKFEEGSSSVSYTGQIARHVLIAELNHYIGNVLKGELDDGTLTSKQDVLDKLNKFFRTTELQYDNFPITFTDAEQGFLTDISGSHKNLVGKLAGNDAKGQHKDWNGSDFAGWGATGSVTPEGLIDLFFEQLADNAEQHLNGIVRQSATGEAITDIYLNADGTDLKQLIQKFLLMAITYSQAADDYFGHETDGKGLTTDNISAVSGKSYSNLEHQFDEGFGYFGAARDYLAYNDNEISGKVSSDEDGRADWNGKHDTDGNGTIDLTSEYNFGQSVNAAKRDRGTAGNTNPTDFTKQAMDAFLAGRALINDNAGMALTDEQMTELLAQRDLALDAWERAIAATAVHYINDTLADLETLGTSDFNYGDLAKHWSELKGFALGLQFNPYSKLTDSQFEQLHTLIGNAPVLTELVVEQYKTDLLAARDIIATALTFDAENVANW